MEEYTKWRKILYEDQGVADNYVPPSFLKELKKNCEHHFVHRSTFTWMKFVMINLYYEHHYTGFIEKLKTGGIMIDNPMIFV